MKLKNIVKTAVLSIIAIVAALFATNVNAKAPEYFDLVRDTSTIINYYEDIVEVPGDTHAIYFPLKYSKDTEYLVFCTGDRSANTENSRYVKTNFKYDYEGAIAAAIIKAGVGENAKKGTSLNKIFFTQLALWKSLSNTGNGFPATEAALSSEQRALFNSLIAAGASAKTSYEDIKNFKITLSDTSLNFTLNGDVYESQVIKVSGKEIKTITTSVNIGEVVEKNGGYVIRIAKSALSEGDNKVTFKVEAKSNSIAVATNYTNGNNSQQTLTITEFDYITNSASQTITGKIVIEVEKQPIPISKVDATNQQELPGARLELTYPDGHTFRWDSTDTSREFILDPGTYQLREKYAPAGYIKSDEVITFTVNEDGGVDTPVVMKNYPLGKTLISKQDIATGKELPDAILIITNEAGEELYKWISGSEPYTIEGLKPGKYFLTEERAPDGYILSKETIEFEVDEYGNVKEMIVMYNEMAPEVPDVPNTASFKSIATSIAGIITIGLGAVVITKAYKKNEAR